MAVKIPFDFFNESRIKALRRLRNGDTYLVIYLRLLCEAKKSGGFIYWDGIEDSLFDELCLSLDEDVNNIVATIQQLEKLGLCSFTGKGVLRIFSPSQLRDRTSSEYKLWRVSVFERDNYTCRSCGASGCKLNAHHIKPWSLFPLDRYDVNNGITLCEACHRAEHKRRNNGGI